jgi:hypothetical protein
LNTFSQLIEALVDGLPQPTGSISAGVIVRATDVDLTLPIESRIQDGAVLHASLPRGRMATGFEMPIGRLSARFQSEDAGDVAKVNR